MPNYDWLELHPKPKKAGLHDSGYQYIRMVGVKDGVKTELNQWSDHAWFNGPVNIDVEADGTIRIMPGLDSAPEWTVDDRPYASSCMVYAEDYERASRIVYRGNQIHFDVKKQYEGGGDGS